MKSIFLAAALVLAVSNCFAESALVDDINHCKWRDGRKISKSQCEDLQDALGNVADRITKIREKLAKTGTDDLDRKSGEKAWAELVQYAKDLMERSYKISKMKSDPYKSCGELRIVAGKPEDLPCDPDAPKKPGEIEEEKEEAALKRKCGKDYLAVRLGMTLARLQECHGAVYETETVTAKGTVKTYRTTHDLVHVQNGVVIGLTKRTD